MPLLISPEGFRIASAQPLKRSKEGLKGAGSGLSHGGLFGGDRKKGRSQKPSIRGWEIQEISYNGNDSLRVAFLMVRTADESRSRTGCAISQLRIFFPDSRCDQWAKTTHGNPPPAQTSLEFRGWGRDIRFARFRLSNDSSIISCASHH